MVEETAILNLQVDQGKAEKDLIRIQKVILDNKKAQQDLTKAYKNQVITQEEYIRENLRLQSNIKKEQQQVGVLTKLINAEAGSRNALKARVSQLVSEYDNLNLKTDAGIKRAKELQKELKSLNSQITKTSKDAGLFKDQIGNYPATFSEAAKSINVAGVSVGDVGARLASFANPATAALGIVTALGSAYANSTLGAKDLEFAHNQLSAATEILTGRFADLITTAEDGEGPISRFISAALINLDPTSGAFARVSAQIKEELEDLNREELKIRAEVAARIEENQEKLTFIADEQESINDKLNASNDIEANLINNKAVLVDVLNKQIEKLNALLRIHKNDEVLLTTILEKELERDKLSASTNKQIEKNNKLQDDLNAKLQEEIRLRNLIAKQGGQNVAIPTGASTTTGDTFNQATGVGDLQIDASKVIADGIVKVNKDAYEADLAAKRMFNQAKLESDKATAIAAGKIAGEASELFEESTEAYKVLASASTLISTYTSAQGAYESLVRIPFAGPTLAAAAAAVAIAQGLKRVAAINGIEFAEGGYTGPGQKYDVAGVVHKGEYVTPKHIVESPAAQGHLRALEGMRRRYADGGFVTNTNTADANQSLMLLNAIKMIPPSVVSWAEGRAVGRRVEFREQLAKL
jgi:hypothetical protein